MRPVVCVASADAATVDSTVAAAAVGLAIAASDAAAVRIAVAATAGPVRLGGARRRVDSRARGSEVVQRLR